MKRLSVPLDFPTYIASYKKDPLDQQKMSQESNASGLDVEQRYQAVPLDQLEFDSVLKKLTSRIARLHLWSVHADAKLRQSL